MTVAEMVPLSVADMDRERVWEPVLDVVTDAEAVMVVDDVAVPVMVRVDDALVVCVRVADNNCDRYYILKGMALIPDGIRYGNAAAELCWSNMVNHGRG